MKNAQVNVGSPGTDAGSRGVRSVRTISEPVAYGDGSEARVLEIMLQVADRTAGSDDLAARIEDWPTRYHLSRSRANLLAPLDLLPGTRVLDVGAGTGTLARVLGEAGCEVTALEGSLERARIADLRCEDLENVAVVCGTPTALAADDQLVERFGGPFDVVLCVGVLEYAASASSEGISPEGFLGVLRMLLKTEGNLALGIENQLGLKYLLGWPEDHLGEAWIGVEGYPGGKGVQTFSRAELSALLRRTGFEQQSWLYPYPDYKLPTTVLADAVFEQPDAIRLVDQLVREPVVDHANQATMLCDSRAAHRTFLSAGLGRDVANSFLVVAGAAAATPPVDDRVLAWIPGKERLRAWRRGFAVRSGEGRSPGARSIVRLGGGSPASAPAAGWLRQQGTDEEFYVGATLEQAFLEALASDDRERWTGWLRRWVDHLQRASREREELGGPNPFVSSETERLLPGEFLDSNFDNFIILEGEPDDHPEDAQLVLFDREWVAEGGVDLSMAVCRGLWYLAGRLVRSGVAMPFGGSIGVAELVDQLGAHAEFEVTGEQLEAYLVAESEFQHLVTGVARTHALQQMRRTASMSRESLATPGGVPFTRLRQEAKRRAANEERVKQLSREVDQLRALAGVRQRHRDAALALAGQLTRVLDPMARRTEWLLDSRRWRLGRRLGDVPYKLARRELEYDIERDLRQHVADARSLLREAKSQGAGGRGSGAVEGALAPVHDLESLVRHAALFPEIRAPFDEDEQRVVAGMESHSRYLSRRYLLGPDAEEVAGTHVVIVMPVRNRADVASTAVRSVLGQTHVNWSLVVVDDASTDGTAEVVRGFDDPRITYVPSAEHVGVSAARNLALSMTDEDAALDDLVAYLDSDNTWEPDFLTVMIGELVTKSEHEVAWSAQRVYRPVASGSTELASVRWGPYNRSLLEHRNYIDLNCVVHTRAAYRSLGGFDEELSRLVDWELLLRYTASFGGLGVPCLLSRYYHGTPGQITTTVPIGPSLIRLDEKVHRDAVFAVPRRIRADEPPVYAVADDVRSGGDSRRRPVSTVIPSFEALECLRLCVEQTLETTQGTDHELIIVDNGSSSEVEAYLRELEQGGYAKIVLNHANYGFTAAANAGIELAGDRDVILLNNDAVPTTDWVGALQDVLDHPAFGPQVGLVVPRQTLFPGTRTIETHVPYARPEREIDVTLSAHHRNVIDPFLDPVRGLVEISFAPFFCVYIPRETIVDVGPLDVEGGAHFRSDRLYCEAVRHLARQRIVYTPHSKLYHFLQQSTGQLQTADPEAYQRIYVRNDWSEVQAVASGSGQAFQPITSGRE
jgi:O-antigen biosynthesis protein